MRRLLKGWGSQPGIAGGTPVPGAVDAPADLLSTLETAETWFFATDARGHITYISAPACARMGLAPAALVGQPFATVFESDPETRGERADRPLQFQMSARGRLSDLVVRLVPARAGADARPAWWSLVATPVLDPSGAFHGHRGIARDVTAEHTRQREDSRAAEFDALTGLANRHRMTRRLDQVLAAYMPGGRPCALLMLDLDRFKLVNDTLGHQAGDDLLRQVARRLNDVIGTRGEIGRLGGDEFQILLPDLDDRGKLGELAGTIIAVVSQPYVIDGKQATIGTSVGIAVAPFDAQDRDALAHAADLALYAAKNGGRGAFRFYSADLRDEKEERAQIEADLAAALAATEAGDPALGMQYQPVVRTSDNMVVAFEALMRWDHPERGALEPDLFIPIAEESGLIERLGEWGLRRACADAAGWPQSVRVAVNISAVQFGRPGFAALVADALADSRLDPDRLELELTESIFRGESAAVDRTFAELKALGVRLALDDFGTGYSSLGYLRSAPFDRLKVDRTFVETCTVKDQSSEKIIAAIIGLADALGMETTVEGVEAFDQLRVVCARGARFVQGFLYAPPLDHAVILDKMADATFRIEPDGPDRHRPERRSVFRRIGVIHEDHRYDALLRDLSATGARVDGLVGVPLDTGLVLDLGAGQLAVCSVVRTADASIGVEFETPLVSDGAGGLVTRHRVPPRTLAKMAGTATPTTPRQFLEVHVPRGKVA